MSFVSGDAIVILKAVRNRLNCSLGKDVRLKTKSAFLFAGIVSAIGLIVWPGCTTPPLPSTRHPISTLKIDDFRFARKTHPNRAEVVSKLGTPDESYPEYGVICYKINRLTRHRIALLFGLLPISTWPDNDRLEVAFIQFDEHEQVKRMEIKIVPAYANLRYTVIVWVKDQRPNSGTR